MIHWSFGIQQTEGEPICSPTIGEQNCLRQAKNSYNL